jgi:hypothetical protein
VTPIHHVSRFVLMRTLCTVYCSDPIAHTGRVLFMAIQRVEEGDVVMTMSRPFESDYHEEFVALRGVRMWVEMIQ